MKGDIVRTVAEICGYANVPPSKMHGYMRKYRAPSPALIGKSGGKKVKYYEVVEFANWWRAVRNEICKIDPVSKQEAPDERGTARVSGVR